MLKWLDKLFTLIEEALFGDHNQYMPQNTPQNAPQAPVEPVTPLVAPTPPNPDILGLWDTPANCRHNLRVICDEEGLTVQQKNILTACVADESGFLTNPRPNRNKDPKTGVVWSTDWGIVQVNDWFHIGPGKDFPSVQYVLDNPEACVRWMANYYKTNGNLNAWASYTSGVYKNYL